MTLPRHSRTMLAAIAVTVALTAAACGSDEASSAGSGSGGSSTAPAAGDGTQAAGEYVAGDYSAEGSYQTPGGTQSVVVDLTLEADGTITDVEVEPQAESGNSVQFQGKFAGGIAAEVEGRSIDEITVSKVSGSSLTSGGFNAAIDDIKAQAAG